MRVQSGWKRYTQPAQHRRRRPRYRSALLILLILSLVAVVWGWRIQTVEVQGATIVPNAAVRDAILAELQQRRFGIVPRSSMVLVGLGQLERTTRERFAFQSVAGRRHRNGIVTFTVTEQPLAALATFSQGAALLIGTTGQVLGTVPESLNGATALPTYQWAGDPPSVGAVLLPGMTIAVLRSLWDELALAGGLLQPAVIAQRSGAPDAFDLRTVGGATVSISVTEQAGDQLAKLQAILRDRASPAARAKLRSIDLRYGDRVYVQ